jgi:hypothetical protein
LVWSKILFDFDISAQNCVIFMLKTQICLKCSIITSWLPLQELALSITR